MSKGMAQNGDAPRGETDLYGEPVAEWSTGDVMYCEAYVDDEKQSHIFVAKYVKDGGEWVKIGLEKLSLNLIFEHARELRTTEW